MADSKKSRGKADRAKVSASEPYEVRYFAKKNKITPAMTKKLIRKYKGSRKRMTAAVNAFKMGNKMIKTTRRRRRR
jgi:hypothetical protein